VRALVLNDYEETPRVEELVLSRPGPGEVLVSIQASGVCRSDLHAISATLPIPTPLVLGHEASGVVDEVGSQVRTVRPGDHVVVTWIPSCGRCFWCLNGQAELCEEANRGAVDGTRADGTTPFARDGEPVHVFSWAGTLAEAVVVPEPLVVPIPRTMPWDEAALLGCGVQTGVGAAIRSPLAAAGTALVLGLGGVGLSIVQGCRIKGARRIIAVDTVEEKRVLARDLGATDLVDGRDDVLAAVLELTADRGVDVAFDAVGRTDLLALAFNAARRGGTAVAVGVPAPHEEVVLNAFSFPSQEKTLTGSWLGGSHPPRDIPQLVALWEAGRLRLQPLITRTYPLDAAPDALQDLAAGRVVRPVVHPQKRRLK
jgi:S-(hydroxymethyl)glutathione dehydrogenase/alcohol dehydrogenase